jgi:hypothetical protein
VKDPRLCDQLLLPAHFNFSLARETAHFDLSPAKAMFAMCNDPHVDAKNLAPPSESEDNCPSGEWGAAP